jgi:hypothetical protein
MADIPTVMISICTQAERSWQESVDLDWVRERPAKRVKAEEEVKAEELEAVKVEDVPNAVGCGSMPPLEKP